MQLKGYWKKLENAIGEVYSYKETLWILVEVIEGNLYFQELGTGEFLATTISLNIADVKLEEFIWLAKSIEDK